MFVFIPPCRLSRVLFHYRISTSALLVLSDISFADSRADWPSPLTVMLGQRDKIKGFGL